MKEKILAGIVMIFFVGGMVGVIAWGLDRQEVVECNQWKEQSNQFAGFYLTEWQKEQCDAHGVEVQAQVISQDR